MFSMEQSWWQFVIMAVVCYLVGSVNFAKLISRANRGDITKMGSGNPGTMNMFRNFGLRLGALTFVCDALKGGIPVVAAHLIYQGQFFAHTAVYVSDVARYFCGLFVIIGHVFPITLGFKGGKGIAASTGLILSFMIVDIHYWYFTVIGFIIFMTTMYVSRYVSLASLVLMTTLTLEFIITAFFGRINATGAALIECNLVMCALTALAFFQHRANIVRLISGTENKIGHHVKVEENLASESGEKNE